MTASRAEIRLLNAEAVELDRLTACPVEDFRRALIDNVRNGARLAALFATPSGSGEGIGLCAVLAFDAQGSVKVARTVLNDGVFESITPNCTQAHLFEREMAEQCGVQVLGHPWLKPVRFASKLAKATTRDEARAAHSTTIGVMDYYRVDGEEVHEVAVGPVHAGVIEPGHFRFQCHGEEVFHLEISLGYQHRGVERAMIGGPTKRSMHYVETLAGDTTIGHATAYAQIVEALGGCRVSPRAEVVRGVALELERLANHVGDLGALAADVGFLPTSAYCGRLRGDFLNMSALICGSRFGRGLVRPGGTGFDIDRAMADELLRRLDAGLSDVANAANLLWETPSVMSRFEETGCITPATCDEIGLVGPAARACGVRRDVRHDYPSGIFRFHQMPVSTWNSGDVFARAFVRLLEIQQSVSFLRDRLNHLGEGPLRTPVGALAPNRIVVSLVEGWRGEICHVAITDASGYFRRYKVVDPSFHNWTGLALALRGQQISDFPLCNKSFNLSYCGFDL